MSDLFIAENCAPTLAGIKTGNLFSTEVTDIRTFRRELRRLNRMLTGKGIRVIPIRLHDGHALVYLYRPERLAEDMRDSETAALLKELGYTCANADSLVMELINRLDHRRSFPHEIGVFLSYPAKDVRSFMKNTRKGVKLVGCWKAYHNTAQAAHTFEQYKRCTASYCSALKRGVPLEQLVG